MPVWIVIGVAAAIFVLVIVIAASFNVFSAETVDEAEEVWGGLPREFTSEDVAALTFRPALRGYRMDDVDEALSLLQARIRELEAAADSPRAVGRRGAHTGADHGLPDDTAEAGEPAETTFGQR